LAIPKKKKASAKSTRRNLTKESFVANRVGGMKSGRAVGCFRDRIESPKWKQRMESGEVWIGASSRFSNFLAGYIHTNSQKKLYYYYYYYYYLKCINHVLFEIFNSRD